MVLRDGSQTGLRERANGIPKIHGAQPTRAFTLVELLVVISIIGVLVALLVVAVGAARAKVQQAAIQAEITGMGQNLDRLTNEYSVSYPHDFSIHNNAAGLLTNQQILNRYLSRIFRNRNPVTDVPYNEQGAADPSWFANLDPAEALYFWLRGFSNDPQNPLFGSPADRATDPAQPNDATTVERTPLFEFDQERLMDVDRDGFKEYYPRNSQAPYVYYVNNYYVANFAKPTPTAAFGLNSGDLVIRLKVVGSNIDANAKQIAPRPYLKLNPPNLDVTTLTAAYPQNPKNYAGADKFQIIAGGLDGAFGLPVDNSTPTSYLAYLFPTGPYPDKQHRDNITSFSSGTLESSMP